MFDAGMDTYATKRYGEDWDTEGKGVPQDYAEAVKWYRLAADQGNAEATASRRTTFWRICGSILQPRTIQRQRTGTGRLERVTSPPPK